MAGMDRADAQKYQLLPLVWSYFIDWELWIPSNGEALDVTRLQHKVENKR